MRKTKRPAAGRSHELVYFSSQSHCRLEPDGVQRGPNSVALLVSVSWREEPIPPVIR
jgi:hypothetical protein